MGRDKAEVGESYNKGLVPGTPPHMLINVEMQAYVHRGSTQEQKTL